MLSRPGGAPLVCDHGRVLIPVGAGHLDERGSRSERGVTARSRRRGATHSNQLTHDHVRRAWRRRIGRSKRTSWHERAPPKVCPITRTTILWRGYEERGAREGHRSSSTRVESHRLASLSPRSPLAPSEALGFTQGDDLYKSSAVWILHGDLISEHAGIVKPRQPIRSRRLRAPNAADELRRHPL